MLKILGADIIANLKEIVLTNTFNGLRHAISQWMRGFPSRFEVKMFQILLQECTLIQNNKTNMRRAFEKIFINTYIDSRKNSGTGMASGYLPIPTHKANPSKFYRYAINNQSLVNRVLSRLE